MFLKNFQNFFLPSKSWKNHPQKLLRIPQIHFFSLTASTAQMAQTEEIMFQNVAYWPTVYRTGGIPRSVRDSFIFIPVFITAVTWISQHLLIINWRSDLNDVQVLCHSILNYKRNSWYALNYSLVNNKLPQILTLWKCAINDFTESCASRDSSIDRYIQLSKLARDKKS